MDVDVTPSTYAPREAATFAEVATKIKALLGDHATAQFEGALEAFRTFLTNEEHTKLSK